MNALLNLSGTEKRNHNVMIELTLYERNGTWAERNGTKRSVNGKFVNFKMFLTVPCSSVSFRGYNCRSSELKAQCIIMEAKPTVICSNILLWNNLCNIQITSQQYFNYVLKFLLLPNQLGENSPNLIFSALKVFLSDLDQSWTSC